MQPGSRSCHRAFNLGIYSLIGIFVAILGLSIKIGRNRKLAHTLEKFGKSNAAVPCETYRIYRAGSTHALNGESNLATADYDTLRQKATLPTVGVSYKALPHTALSLLKDKSIVTRCLRLQAKNLYLSTRRLAETQPRLYNLCVVENHQAARRNILWQIAKDILADITFIINKQFGAVALLQRIFCYSLVGKRVIVLRNFYIFYTFNHFPQI